MRYRFGRLALAVALLSAARPLIAQDQAKPKAAGVSMGGPFLLSTRGLRIELEFRAEQNDKVDAVLHHLARKHAADRAALPGLPKGERQVRQRALLKTVSGEVKTALAFTAAQSTRFDQVMLQHRRFDAFLDPEVTAKLRLNAAQLRAIAILQAKGEEEIRALHLQLGDDRALLLKRVAALSREWTTRAVDLLSPEQRTIWKELTGKPFEPPAVPEPRRPD